MPYTAREAVVQELWYMAPDLWPDAATVASRSFGVDAAAQVTREWNL